MIESTALGVGRMYMLVSYQDYTTESLLVKNLVFVLSEEH